MGYSIFDETMVDMTWPEVEKATEDEAIVLLPTGVIEEHGPHLGLGVDTYCSSLMCKLTRRELEAKGIKTLVAPPYYWGINNATGSFPGSFSVRKETMKAVLYDILASLKRWGFTYVFNINWHGETDHVVAILEAIEEARIHTGIMAYFLVPERMALNIKRFGLTGKEEHIIVQKPSPRIGSPPKYLNIHAAAIETGIMVNYFPDQVNVELARTLKPTGLTIDDIMVWMRGGSNARQMTPLGYFGDPASFAPEAGRQLMESGARSMANLIEIFIKGNYEPPEIQ